MEQRLSIGEGETAIRAHFDDHAVILGLGLRSIINIPVVQHGRCLGTLNFLWPVAMAELFGLVVASDWAVVTR